MNSFVSTGDDYDLLQRVVLSYSIANKTIIDEVQFDYLTIVSNTYKDLHIDIHRMSLHRRRLRPFAARRSLLLGP